MTKDEALRLALEALETSMYPQQKQLQAITAIKAALEAKDEPVAWAEEIIDDLHALYDSEMIKENDSGAALIRLDDAVCLVIDTAQRHTTPPQQEAKDAPVAVDVNTSDGYHTFNELYEFRKAYNVALFNEWASNGKCSVHKSWRHNDGELCFGGGWFIVVAVLPQGQISNHYEAKDWGLFSVLETERALFEFDGHTGTDVVERLKSYAPPQRTWVGLTDDEFKQIMLATYNIDLNVSGHSSDDYLLWNAIEAKLKEKNT